MADHRKSGILLIAGSLGLLFTMAFHPSGASSVTSEQAAHLSFVSGLAHSLALLSVLLLFLGACGLTRSIAAPDRLSFAALVTYGFSCVAVLLAASASGFIFPGILKDMIRDVPSAAHQWQITLDAVSQINQAFGRISVVAASFAIILWSVSVLRNGGFSRGLAVYGCIISALVILGIVLSRSRLDVHRMAAIALGQGVWFILVGSHLWSGPQTLMSQQPNSRAGSDISVGANNLQKKSL